MHTQQSVNVKHILQFHESMLLKLHKLSLNKKAKLTEFRTVVVPTKIHSSRHQAAGMNHTTLTIGLIGAQATTDSCFEIPQVKLARPASNAKNPMSEFHTNCYNNDEVCDEQY